MFKTGTESCSYKKGILLFQIRITHSQSYPPHISFPLLLSLKLNFSSFPCIFVILLGRKPVFQKIISTPFISYSVIDEF